MSITLPAKAEAPVVKLSNITADFTKASADVEYSSTGFPWAEYYVYASADPNSKEETEGKLLYSRSTKNVEFTGLTAGTHYYIRGYYHQFGEKHYATLAEFDTKSYADAPLEVSVKGVAKLSKEKVTKQPSTRPPYRYLHEWEFTFTVDIKSENPGINWNEVEVAVETRDFDNGTYTMPLTKGKGKTAVFERTVSLQWENNINTYQAPSFDLRATAKYKGKTYQSNWVNRSRYDNIGWVP